MDAVETEVGQLVALQLELLLVAAATTTAATTATPIPPIRSRLVRCLAASCTPAGLPGASGTSEPAAKAWEAVNAAATAMPTTAFVKRVIKVPCKFVIAIPGERPCKTLFRLANHPGYRWRYLGRFALFWQMNNVGEQMNCSLFVSPALGKGYEQPWTF